MWYARSHGPQIAIIHGPWPTGGALHHEPRPWLYMTIGPWPERDGVCMSTEPEENHIRQIYARQAEQEARERPPPTIAKYLGPGPAAAGADLGQRIAATAARLRDAVNDPNLQANILAKIARAIEEGRIPEGEIAQIMACMHLAKNRGAYFVAAAKKAFGRNKLSWHTEDWQ
jgi:hypothetical protein